MMKISALVLVLGGLLTVTYAQLRSSDAVNNITSRDEFLLLVDSKQNRINVMSKDGRQTASLDLRIDEQPLTVDYEPQSGVLFWTEKKPAAIKRAKLDGSLYRVVHTLSEISSPRGLAVDDVAGLVFYTDDGRDLIRVTTVEGLFVKTIASNTINPRTIQLDPRSRHVYFVDRGSHTIERARYNGNNRTVLVRLGTESRVDGLALDIAESRMYWADSWENTIESSRLDGTNRRQEYLYTTNRASKNASDQALFYSITLDDDYLYISDLEQRSVFRMKKGGSNLEAIGPAVFGELTSIKMYRKSKIKGQSSICNNRDRGGCSQFCLPMPYRYECACPDGMVFQENSDRICSPALFLHGEHQLFWLEFDGSQTAYVSSIMGEPKDVLSKSHVVIRRLPFPGRYWSAVDFDAKNNALVISDGRDRSISTLNVQASIDVTPVHFGTSSEVQGVAVDWISNNIYWADAGYNWIAMAHNEPKTLRWKVIVDAQLDQPHGIAVHPAKGLLFWTDWGEVNKIERSDLSGNNRSLVVFARLEKPTALVIDYSKNRLYWTNRNMIESSNLDGSDRRAVLPRLSVTVVSMTMFGDYLFALTKPDSTQTTTTGNTLWLINIGAPTPTTKTINIKNIPFGITVFAKERQPTQTSPCATASCDQLCVGQADGTAKCICQQGFKMSTSGCIHDINLSSPTLAFSMGDRLCMVPLTSHSVIEAARKDTKCILYTNRHEYRALAYHFRRGEIFLSDYKYPTPTIRRTSIMKPTNNSVIVYGPGNPDGLAVDWISENLYWTASSLNQIWISRTDGSYQKILILDGLDKPHGITLDPGERRLYWGDEGGDGRISRSYLDGSQREVYLTLDHKPGGMTIDLREQRLYWVDLESNAIESVGINKRRGTRMEFFSGQKLYDLATVGDYLVYSDQQEPGGIHTLHKERTAFSKASNLYQGKSSVFDVLAVDRRNQPMLAGLPCARRNGGCQQLCLPNERGRRCACVDGMKLARDEVSCVSSKPLLKDTFFLVSDDFRHQIYQLPVDKVASQDEIRGIPTPPQDRPIPVEYDFKHNKVYWAEFERGIIKRSDIDGSNEEMLYMSDKDSRVDGLVIDPVARLLYYADMGKDVIGVIGLDTNRTRVVLKDISSPRALALDVKQGHLYFATRRVEDQTTGTRGRGAIYRAYLDGTNATVVIGSDLVSPNGIALDLNDGMMYWCDGVTEQILSSRLDGTDRQVLLQLDQETDPFSIAVYGESVYWTDWRRRGLHKAPKQFPKKDEITVLHARYFTGLNDIKLLSKSTRTDGPLSTAGSTGDFTTTGPSKGVSTTTEVNKGSNKCEQDNGGCDYLCVSAGNGQNTCLCPEKLLPGRSSRNVCVPPACKDIPISSDVNLQCSDVRIGECTMKCGERKVSIRCDSRGYWNKPLNMSCRGESSNTGASKGPLGGNLFTIIIPVAAAAGVILIIILILAIILIRRRRKKSQRPQYREHNNMPERHVPTAVYDAANSSVHMAEDLAFDNPGYARVGDISRGNLPPIPPDTEAGPLPEKKGFPDDDEDFHEIDPDGIENPGYVDESDGAVRKGENAKTEDPPYESLRKYQSSGPNA